MTRFRSKVKMTLGEELENIINTMELKETTKVRQISGVTVCLDRIMITDVQPSTVKTTRAFLETSRSSSHATTHQMLRTTEAP